jgi:Skp family chaperone for outer membrane proteins
MKLLHIVLVLLLTSLIIFTVISQISRYELQQQIANLKTEITNHKNQIASLSQEIANLEQELSYTKQELSDTKQKLLNEQTKLSQLQNELTNTLSRLNNLESRISRERITYPTYSDVLSFIEEDDTDKQKYVSENYTFICTDFTNRFINNFLKKGFFSCEAIIYLPENSSHSLVAINTTDRGVIFVEPQADKVITSLSIGDNYCSYIGQDCTWTILAIKHCFTS